MSSKQKQKDKFCNPLAHTLKQVKIVYKQLCFIWIFTLHVSYYAFEKLLSYIKINSKSKAERVSVWNTGKMSLS